MRIPFLSCILFLDLAGGLYGEEFPEPYNSEPLSDETLVPAQEAAAGFAVPEGFEVTVYASEPQVRNPIAMTWDEKGRLWVAENYTYAERAKRFEFALRDRVIIFHDADHDGRAEKRTVFLDTVQNLTSIEIDNEGLWLMCPPQLLFVPDRNHDDIPDGPPEVVLDGFTVAKSNYHNFANGLRWGPDGWLYGRCGHSCPGKIGVPGTPKEQRIPIDGGMWRYHPTRKVAEVLTHGTTNPWGHDWDEHGELFFINTVNGHLWHMIPGAHFKEPFGPSKNPLIFDRLEMHADHWHFDTKTHWTKSRHGTANDFGGGHAHIGMAIYQADHLPKEWHGKLLTWNMHGRRLNRERLTRKGSGYVASHEPDTFLASDKWFRGLEIQTGPDGALYALDWSDTGECHDSTGVHRTSGRIYRFSHGTPKVPDFQHLATLDAAALPHLIAHPNVWYFRQAQRLLTGKSLNGDIQSYLDPKHPTVTRLRALWLLHATGQTSTSSLMGLLNDPDEHLRVWAIRLLTDTWTLDTLYGPRPSHSQPQPEVVARLMTLAKQDPSKLVRLTLASTLQRLPATPRLALAKHLAAHPEDAHDHNLPYLVWFGCYSLGPQLPQLAEATEWPLLLQWISRALGEQIKTQPDALDALIVLAKNHPKKAPPILKGLKAAFRGWIRAPKPPSWDATATQLAHDPALRPLVTDLSILFGDGRALDALRDDVLDTSVPLATRKRALQTLITQRHPGLKDLCSSLLRQHPINTLAIKGLATLDDPSVAPLLLKHYKKPFRKQQRTAVITALVARPAWAHQLLDHIARKHIPRTDLTTYHARQILALDDPALHKKLTANWGSLRQTPKEKRAFIGKLKTSMTPTHLAKADLVKGRLHYQTHCAACHKLHGKGGTLGPDLTGSGRSSLDYLLENIVDPNALVSANHHLTTITLEDGRTLTGVIARSTPETLTLRTLDQEGTYPQKDIVRKTTSSISVMPEGLLESLTPEQQRDLLAFLMKP